MSRITVTAALVTAFLAGCVPGAEPYDPPDPTVPQPGTGGSGGRVGPMGGRGGTGGSPQPPGFGGSGPTPAFLSQPAVSGVGWFAPALSGGTLLVLADGKTAFASDPDRDALYLADLENERLLATVPLQPGDEPGRAVEDSRGAIHVVLRRAGAVLAVDRTGTAGEQRAVCPAPRGIAYDTSRDQLHVACAGGELVTLPAAGGAVLRTVQLERDLRDVVVAGSDRLFISLFRSAELLVVSAGDGKFIDRRKTLGSRPAQQTTMSSIDGVVTAATPNVAWRLRPLVGGGAAMIHQESTNSELGTERGGYGGGPCRSPVAAAVTVFPDSGGATTGPQMMSSILPVDFAYSRDGKRVATVFAGNAFGGGLLGGPQVSLSMASNGQGSDCMIPTSQPPPVGEPVEFRQPVGEAVAVDFDGQGRVVVQTREPARLEIISHRGGTIKLANDSRFDGGHAIFHMATGFGLACASCHPEGGDDGRVWRFAKLGALRTQNLRGGIAQTAPFHWDGDMRDLTQLMSEVFTGRMGGPSLSAGHVTTLGAWMDRLPAVAGGGARDEAAALRGKALFNDAKVACATCHTGSLMTNNASVSVGTGRVFQVPSLRGLGARAPYMHNGCAKTLADRFTPACGGGDLHGVTSHLDAAQLADLVAYLESL